MSRGDVLVLQHQTQDHAAYLRTWLERERVPYVILNTEEGQTFPRSVDGWRALAVLGGEHGANDDRAALRDAERLIVSAFDADVPVLGLCLGGQLMARALGARVREAPTPEIGWLPIDWLDQPATAEWFGATPPQRVFQWHYDMFEVPSAAVSLARSDACPSQAFAYGPHLALQFHLELDAAKLRSWVHAADPRYDAARPAHLDTIQSGGAMQELATALLPAHQALADRVYRRWLEN